ncbi:serine hydrolase domain-containing protein [uncultured Tateyamaria sp.]|uniref:serine hydrolase domain-containing protein n=1 Tax=uncultured Tateyamaria sp. TaxID=455651 RepID=UPI00261ED49E|nr:serine hydrolase domain-containing protein [uncultured Tateyamaria sp.]
MMGWVDIARTCAAAACAALVATTAMAQDPVRIERIQAAFDAWTAEHAAKGTGAIAYEGDVIGTLDSGIDPATPIELASLSKAITGVCVRVLFEEGTLHYNDSTVTLLDRDPPATVGQLMTHSAGFADDVTQRAMPGWLGDPTHRAAEAADMLQGADGPPNTFIYNNANYALLALMIEKVTGTTYEEACRSRVLDPLGITTAKPSPQSGAFLSWGGWSMTSEDYARFHAHWFGATVPTGFDPRGQPNVDLGENVFYGTGTLFRSYNRRYNFWHHGSLCILDGLEVGAFAVTWEAKWTLVVGYDKCLPWDALFALDAALTEAVYGAIE